ncbi:MAG: serine protease [Pseudomonadota bacterium]
MIRTLTAQQDGQVFENRGSGVIIGNYYLTVYHNLDPRPAGHRLGVPRGRSFLGDQRVNPIYSDPSSDVAILPLPAALCAGSCADPAPATRALPQLNQAVRWYLGSSGSPSGAEGWRQGRILARTVDAVLSAPRTADDGTRDREGCAAGLVYEVDAPFFPGSSGMAVWDEQDNLLGIAQGSYERADGRITGYFRPWYCIQQHWPGQLRVLSPP